MRCLCVKTLSASFGVTRGQPVGLTDASLPVKRHLKSSAKGFCPARFDLDWLLFSKKLTCAFTRTERWYFLHQKENTASPSASDRNVPDLSMQSESFRCNKLKAEHDSSWAAV